MSKELDKTTEEIMSKIHKGQIKMRPRVYFVLGYVITIIGLAMSFISSIFFVGLTRFALRSHGYMGQYRVGQLLNSFSWWIPFLAVFGLVLGLWLIRKYDFSYKINFKLLVVGVIAFVLLAGFIIDTIGLNDFYLKRGKGRGQEFFNKIKNQQTYKRSF